MGVVGKFVILLRLRGEYEGCMVCKVIDFMFLRKVLCGGLLLIVL